MRESELRRALGEEFGHTYAPVLVRDHWIKDIGCTAEEALAGGMPPREVWLAICADFEVPVNRRHGRGMVEPKKD